MIPSRVGQVWELSSEGTFHRVVLLVLESPSPEDRAYAPRHELARCVVLDTSTPSAWPLGNINDWLVRDLDEGNPRVRRIL